MERRTGNGLVNRLMVAGLMLAVGVAGVFAQPAMPQGQPTAPTVDADSREFVRFAEALTEVEQIQRSTSEIIDELLASFSEGQERFIQIHQMAQAANGALPSDVPGEVADEYEETIAEIGEIQTQSQQEMIEYVEESGLTVQRFNEIVMAVQSDAELQSALNGLR